MAMAPPIFSGAASGGSGFGNFMNSPGGGALVQGGLGILGGLIGGAGQGAINEAQLKAQKEAQLRQEALQREQLAAQQAQTGLQASQQDPLAQQRSRQQQALMAAVLPGLRNASITSNIPGMNKYVPQISGGLRIPEGGFDASTLGYFSPESRAAAEGQYWRQAAPFTPPPDLSKVGYGEAGQGVTEPAAEYYKTAEAEAKAKNAALLASLQQTTTAPTASGGTSKAKKALGAGAGALAGAGTGAYIGSVVPGLGTAVGAGVGGILGGLKGLFS